MSENCIHKESRVYCVQNREKLQIPVLPAQSTVSLRKTERRLHQRGTEMTIIAAYSSLLVVHDKAINFFCFRNCMTLCSMEIFFFFPAYALSLILHHNLLLLRLRSWDVVMTGIALTC